MSTVPTRLPDAAEVAALAPAQLVELLRLKEETIIAIKQEVQALQHQLEWFKRQLFGRKSERFAPQPDPQQLSLGAQMPVPPQQEPQTQVVPEHKRRKAANDFTRDSTDVPFFDEARVPVQTIEVPTPEAQGLEPSQYEVIGQKVSYRLAQRPGSYVVLKYVRQQIKRRDTQTLHCAPAPSGVLEGSRADVSLVAGLLVDKFVYHLPLYRQHQRMADAGITVSRPWLTQLVQQGAQLIEPVYEAQLESIRASRFKAIDETPIKAGRAEGAMKGGYFWPVYGQHDEVCFPFFESREHKHAFDVLGQPQAGAVVLSDGYAAYSEYAKKTKVTHAQCWAHTRREFFEAQGAEPQLAQEALRQIGTLYKVEEDIRAKGLKGEAKRMHRLTHSKPLVELFFEWVQHQLEQQGLLPSNPLTKALGYARERRVELQVFLSDADVPIDTNHLERALRVIPMGRKNWIFCWTEVGAKHAGIVQSLCVTCRLHGIDPMTYLIDVLQRVGQHPAARVAELTPRLWKQHFAGNPLGSDLHKSAG
jgi:transposase